MNPCAAKTLPSGNRFPNRVRFSFTSWTVCLSALAGFASGCGGGGGDSLNRQPVSGTVTLDGQPLDQGSIYFTPVTGGDTAGGQNSGAGTAITAGAYALTAENGPPPGRYVVRINSTEGGASDPNAMPGETKPTKERIPKSWNSQSKHEVEVVEGDNSFPFDIKSKE